MTALSTMPLPSDKPTLRSFLGLCTYLGSGNIPHYSALTKPLWDMCTSDSQFTWNSRERTAFENVKKELSHLQSLKYFDEKKPIVIQTDACYRGLGAVLLQDDCPVFFASRTLTPTETRYSQIELELLAIVFAVRRFRLYLTASRFVVTSDHLPLIAIWKKEIDKLSTRLQRWITWLSGYDMEIVHIPGKQNVLADCSILSPAKRFPP